MIIRPNDDRDEGNTLWLRLQQPLGVTPHRPGTTGTEAKQQPSPTPAADKTAKPAPL